ncbi:MAG: transposase [Myxococcota bacterium]
MPFPSRHPCHVTLKVRRGVPSLRSVRLVREMERTFSGACDRGWFRVTHYSIQRDHVHLVVEAKSAEALGRGMKSIGARFARAVNRVFGRSGRVLADTYHSRVLRTPREVRNVLAYVLLNGRRHAARRRRAGPVSTARIDPASSGRWFDGWRGRTRGRPRADREGVPPVARSHTWLLRVGWRRCGLIDPCEVPGTKGG